ncbi:acyl carrier protein [Aquabacterium lacunae]|uniref:Acyl carrier protein n=1 Tax=Aquabacterium lacunae TaxID=2528630 RepID=A0A4Q9GUU5_9BURK|nr:acyl carrier protein [Aquabacterium lacunae]TBO27907.1 acyl carrier protein [Aquabacterium lacunae]
MSVSESLFDAVRDALSAQGRLSVDARTLSPDADLYESGLTSQCSVNVMLTLEGRFDIEFADHLLTRSTFSSIARIADALAQSGAA